MTYLKNVFLLSILKLMNKLGRGVTYKKNLFSIERILKLNFPEKTNFYFVQVGANDGISFDFLYDFIIRRNSKGIVIEPITDYFLELKENYKNYKNITPINLAVHPTEKNSIIYKIEPNAKQNYPDWVKGIASMDFEHHKKLKIDSKDIIEEKVETDTLMNILSENYNSKKIDYLQIDTEGFDYEIIKMIDFSKLAPSIIRYEYVNLKDSEKNFSKKLLKTKGYYLFIEGGDMMAINLNKIKLKE